MIQRLKTFEDNRQDEERQPTPDAPTVLTAPTEWDFRAVPLTELEACLCYELARETETFAELSKSYLEQLKKDADTQTAVPSELIQSHIESAFLLESLAPHFDLRNTTWGNMPAHIRSAAARGFRNRRAFSQAGASDVQLYGSAVLGTLKNERGEMPGVAEWKDGRLLFKSDYEVTLVAINWEQPVDVIEKECKAWLADKCKHRKRKKLKGRHAKTESHIKAKDLLRGLSAMRLLAHHSMTEAIQIAAKTKPAYPYAGTIDDDGRLYGQAAWDTGIERTADYFRHAFPREMQEPRSRRLYQKRRGK